MKTFTSKTQQTGLLGEDAAVQYLESFGYRIVERNVATARGEIDIVAQKGETYVLCEVKAGYKGSWFNPADNLTPVKLKKFLLASAYYMATKGVQRYETVGIVVLLGRNGSGEVPTIELFPLVR